MRFVLILLLFVTGCSYKFKTNDDRKNNLVAKNQAVVDNREITVEELENLPRLEQIKLEMQERLAKIKNEQ
tara:strand:- start:582 stop:794 length:213 start_codon:yes stop_codon:yes gene_type:complete